MPGPSVVVLAGGASIRFGSDKLTARVGEHDLLSLAVAGLPTGTSVTVVGPRRRLLSTIRDTSGGPPRTVRWVQESPAPSGPARALHAGVTAALAVRPALPVVVLPGDAPDGHLALLPLVEALAGLRSRDPAALGVVGVDASGRLQPLHLGLAPGAGAALAADPPRPGTSARSLVHALGLLPVLLPDRSTRDIDTVADLEAWQRDDPDLASPHRGRH